MPACVVFGKTFETPYNELVQSYAGALHSEQVVAS